MRRGMRAVVFGLVMAGSATLLMPSSAEACDTCAAKAAPPVKADANALHTCPMHPKIEQKGPGRCPDCNMFLVPKAEAAKADANKSSKK